MGALNVKSALKGLDIGRMGLDSLWEAITRRRRLALIEGVSWWRCGKRSVGAVGRLRCVSTKTDDSFVGNSCGVVPFSSASVGLKTP